MNFDWPWSKTYKIKCADGNVRIIYKNLDAACPLFIKDWQADLTSGIKGADNLEGNVEIKYKSEIKGLLFSLNEQNQSLMMSFRNVYLAYITNPCANGDFLFRELEKLLDEQRKISMHKVHMTTLIHLANNSPNDTAAFINVFNTIASGLGGPALATAASLEIAESRKLAIEVLGVQK